MSTLSFVHIYPTTNNIEEIYSAVFNRNYELLALDFLHMFLLYAGYAIQIQIVNNIIVCYLLIK